MEAQASLSSDGSLVDIDEAAARVECMNFPTSIRAKVSEALRANHEEWSGISWARKLELVMAEAIVNPETIRPVQQPIHNSFLEWLIFATPIHGLCIECLSNRSPPDHDSSILQGVAQLCFLIRFALFPVFKPRCSLHQLPPSPTLAQLRFSPKLLRRFMRGTVAATAQGLTSLAIVSDDARTTIIWRNCIFARVMSGCVMREEMRLQTAAATRIAPQIKRQNATQTRYSGLLDAAKSGDVVDVLSYLITDENCVNKRGP